MEGLSPALSKREGVKSPLDSHKKEKQERRNF